MSENTWENLPDWERVLSSAARLQQILPDAVLVGGAAAALYAQHRFSRDTDHILTDLRTRFDQVLAELEIDSSAQRYAGLSGLRYFGGSLGIGLGGGSFVLF